MKTILAKNIKKGDVIFIDGEAKKVSSVSANSGDGKTVIHIGDKVIVRDIFSRMETVGDTQEEASMSKYKFFAYDPETGFETFETAEQAKAHAEDCIQCYRDEAPDGWNEQVGDVCWGEIKAQTVEVGRHPATEDEASEFGYWCDYSLKDVADEQ